MFCVAICDDEEFMCTQIEHLLKPYVKKYDLNIEVFYSGEKLYRALLEGEHYDLIFLDIELKLMNGVDLGKKIRDELKDEKVHIVYISAKQEYAMKLFEVRPLNFLVKPIIVKEVIDNVEKAIQLSDDHNTCFEFRRGQSRYREEYGNILYFESSGRKVSFYTKEGKQELYGKINEIEEKAPRSFVRIHQSYLINCIYIKKWKYEQIYLVNGKVFPISQPYRKKVRKEILTRNLESKGQ